MISISLIEIKDDRKRMKHIKRFSTITVMVRSIMTYSTFSIQSLAFSIPRPGFERYKKIFAGSLRSFLSNKIKTYKDPARNDLQVKRTTERIKTFSSVCPHLGCKVHWE